MKNKKAMTPLLIVLILLLCTACGNAEHPQENIPAPEENAASEEIIAKELVPEPPEKIVYTILFNVDGVITAATVEAGDKIQRPGDPVKEGWSFEGWFSAAEGGERWDFGGPASADLTLYARWMEEIVEYNFLLYLQTAKTDYNTGDTIRVDVMLSGDLNYVMAESEIAYDTSLLEYVGYDNSSGWMGQFYKGDSNFVTTRNIASADLNVGLPCETPQRLVTLNFRVKNDLPAASVAADLSFNSILVAAPPDIPEPAVSPGAALNLTFHKR